MAIAALHNRSDGGEVQGLVPVASFWVSRPWGRRAVAVDVDVVGGQRLVQWSTQLGLSGAAACHRRRPCLRGRRGSACDGGDEQPPVKARCGWGGGHQHERAGAGHGLRKNGRHIDAVQPIDSPEH